MALRKCGVSTYFLCVTSHHRCSGLKYHLFMLSQLCVTGVQEQCGSTLSSAPGSQTQVKMLAGPSSYLEALGKRPPLSSFPLLAEFSSLQLSDWGPCFFGFICLPARARWGLLGPQLSDFLFCFLSLPLRAHEILLWAHLNNSGYPSYFKTNWLVTLIMSATFLCHVRKRNHGVAPGAKVMGSPFLPAQGLVILLRTWSFKSDAARFEFWSAT